MQIKILKVNVKAHSPTVPPSACFLVSGTPTQEGVDRIKLLCQTRDGFKLAEEDLRRRGPGELLGEA